MDFQENKAIYLQIAERFFENILTKKWQAHDRVPAVREVAIEVEVNPNTVMRTFAYLQQMGVIYNRRGIGYFVTEEAYDIVMKLKKDLFFREALPHFFKKLDLLNISIDEVKAWYEQS